MLIENIQLFNNMLLHCAGLGPQNLIDRCFLGWNESRINSCSRRSHSSSCGLLWHNFGNDAVPTRKHFSQSPHPHLPHRLPTCFQVDIVVFNGKFLMETDGRNTSWSRLTSGHPQTGCDRSGTTPFGSHIAIAVNVWVNSVNNCKIYDMYDLWQRWR